jgi:hypothetical protein
LDVDLSILCRMFCKRIVFFVVLIGCCFDLQAASAKIIKVLPQYLDWEGRRALSPSLYERDAYQDHLRKHPAERSALRFLVQWKAGKSAPANLNLRVEIRGSKETQGKDIVLERSVKRKAWLSTWSSVTLEGDEFQRAGEVVAWRVSLWQGDQLLADQKSFLW